jgi:DNA mismatch repair protein MutL
MVLIDQHAAHERVAYERLRRQRAARRLEIQPMLVPEVIELDAIRHAAAADAAPTLAELGFDLEPFGGRAWVLKAAPAALGVVDARALVLDLVDELRELGRADAAIAERDAALLSCAACHSVVRAGDALGPAEIRALLAAMDEIDFGAHCPHGRPVFVEFTARELGAMFHRS